MHLMKNLLHVNGDSYSTVPTEMTIFSVLLLISPRVRNPAVIALNKSNSSI